MQTFVIETKFFSSDANCDIGETYVITVSAPNLDTTFKIEADIRRQLLETDFVTFENQTIRSYDIVYGEFKVFELDDWVCMKVNSLKPIETRIKQSLASLMTEIPHGLTPEEIITFIETKGISP